MPSWSSLLLYVLIALGAALGIGLPVQVWRRARRRAPRLRNKGIRAGDREEPPDSPGVREQVGTDPKDPPMPPAEPQEPVNPAHTDLPGGPFEPADEELLAELEVLREGMHRSLEPDDGEARERARKTERARRRERIRRRAAEVARLAREVPPSVRRATAAGCAPEPAARFYAFHPQEVAPASWFRLHAYVARAGAEEEVRSDLERVAERPVDLQQLVRPSSRPLAEGAVITVTPRAQGIEFNPRQASLAFLRDLHRFDFDGRADAALAGGVAVGEAAFSVAGVIVGVMPLAIYVALDEVEVPPLRFTEVEHPACRRIFPSYSHLDTHVVHRLEVAYRALGDRVLRDALALRSGERWQPRLLELIEEADLFQLFWSRAAAESPYVADEWSHALGLVGAGRKHGEFVRPVYWRKPLSPPPLPAELATLHFHFDPELDDRPAPPEAP